METHNPLNITLDRSAIRQLLPVVTLLLCGLGAAAQGTEFSPYSRHGLGLGSSYVPPVQAGLGGLSTLAADGYTFSASNPASAGALVSTTFQVSSHGTRLGLWEEGAGDFAAANTGSIGPMSLAFKRIGGKNALVLGMIPAYQTGYAITQSSDVDGVGSIAKTYDGLGGISNAHVGWARSFRSSKTVPAGAADSVEVQGLHLHLGAQVHYLFGSVERTSRLDILDPSFLDNRTTTSMRHRGVGYDVGLLMDQLLVARYKGDRSFEKSITLRIGASLEATDSLETEYRRLAENTQTFGGVVTSVDTASFAEFTASSALPMAIKAGAALMFEHGNGRRVFLGAEISRKDWSLMNDDASGINWMGTGWKWGTETRLGVGLQWLPGNAEQRNPFWGSATYRVGFNTSTLPLTRESNDATLDAWTVSAGLSVPMRGSRSASRVHFGMDFGQRQMNDGIGLQEEITNVHIGFTLNPFYKNIWLTPRLYD